MNLFNQVIRSFRYVESFFISRFSYKNIVFFESVIIFLLGIIVGSIIMTYIFSKIFIKTKRVDNKGFNKVSLVTFEEEGLRTYFVNDGGNIFETMRTIWIIIFNRITKRKKPYTIKNASLTQKIMIALLVSIIFILFFVLGLIITITIHYPI
ncbi:hypothetical protein P5F12_13185 [Clostridium perfringens]|nr:hypothetical protein [Clostridium perfringens]